MNCKLNSWHQKEMRDKMKNFYSLLRSAYILYLFQLGFTPLHAGVTVEGENGDMMLYHKIVLTVEGPDRTENEATFKDYRMTVDFEHQSGKTFTISGYFAADGDAANTGATSGNKWRCNFRPDETGTWEYTIHFRQGPDIALKVNTDSSGSTAISPDGTSGSFTILPSDKTGKDFRNPERGPLKYVGKHLLKYSGSDNYFVRAGMGVPEALFAYDGFDNTPNANAWSSHASHYQLNPSPSLLWQGDKGKNLMGAANYTIQQGANTLYGVMFNVPGDGGDSRFPWVSASDRTTFDVSKLEQWDRVLTHFNNAGVAFLFLFGEVENEGDLSDVQRKLFFREATARFGHHSAITFILSEEMEATSIADANAQSVFIKGVDGHDSPVGIHTRGNSSAHTTYYDPLAAYPSTTYACIQTRESAYSDLYSETRRIRAMSDGQGQTPWLCCPDEARIAGSTSLKTDASDPSHNLERINALWGSIMAGGMGVSLYSTENGGDVRMTSFVEFQNFLNQCGAAIDFMWDNNIPLGDMAPNDALVSTGHCIALEGNTYVIQLPKGGTCSLDLSGQTGRFNVLWLNTKTGDLLVGDTPNVQGGGTQSLGSAPGGYPTDKVILVTTWQSGSRL